MANTTLDLSNLSLESLLKIIDFLALGKAFLILVVGWTVSVFLTKLSRRLLCKAKIDPTLRSSFVTLISILLKTLVLLSAMSTLGIQISAFAAVLGALSFAIGLSLKDNIANVADGIALLGLRPVRVGDFIQAGDVMGTVQRIGVFMTEINSSDNLKVWVPNSQINGKPITNYSVNTSRRISLNIGVEYDTDLQKAQRVLLETIQSHKGIYADPAVSVVATEFGDSAINFWVRAWCDNDVFFDLRSDLIMAIKAALDAEGISIAFPHLTIIKK